MSDADDRAYAALNRLTRWRLLFVGRILGTRPIDDAAYIGLRDVFDRLLILRAECNAITALLLAKGVCTEDELSGQLAVEADLLATATEAVFPGYRATDVGVETTDIEKAKRTVRGWAGMTALVPFLDRGIDVCTRCRRLILEFVALPAGAHCVSCWSEIRRGLGAG